MDNNDEKGWDYGLRSYIVIANSSKKGKFIQIELLSPQNIK